MVYLVFPNLTVLCVLLAKAVPICEAVLCVLLALNGTTRVTHHGTQIASFLVAHPVVPLNVRQRSLVQRVLGVAFCGGVSNMHRLVR